MSIAFTDSATDPRSFTTGPLRIQPLNWESSGGDTTATFTASQLSKITAVSAAGLKFTSAPTFTDNSATLAFVQVGTAEVVPTPEIYRVRDTGDGNANDVIGAANTSFFTVYDGNNDGHYWWIDVTGGSNIQADPVGAFPGLAALTSHILPVAVADTLSQVRTKILNAINADVPLSFSASFTVPPGATFANPGDIWVTNIVPGLPASEALVTGNGQTSSYNDIQGSNTSTPAVPAYGDILCFGY